MMSKEKQEVNYEELTKEELLEIIEDAKQETEDYKNALVEIAEALDEEEELTEIDKVEGVLFSERMLYIHDEISQETLSQVSPLIDYYNLKDKDIPIEERKTIYIKIGTYGGEAYETLGIIDSIENSETPIHVHVEGKAMSAGFYIWASAKTRSMGKRAVLMYHQMQLNGLSGTLQQLTNQINELKRMQDNLDELIIENLNVPKEKITEINNASQDWYIDYKLATEYKMF